MTQAQIAKDLGVSQTTVSYALRGGGKVSAELRRKVMAKTGGGLKPVRSRTLGILVTQDTFRSPYFPRYSSGIQRRAEELGLLVTQHICDDMRVSPSLLAEAMGLINLTSSGAPLEGVDDDVPMVRLNSFDLAGKGDSVMPDNAAGIHQAAQRLWDLGHRRIGYLCYGRMKVASPHPAERYGAYCQALASLGLPHPPDAWISCPWEEAQFRQDAESLAERHFSTWLAAPEAERPTAYVCFNDVFALMLLRNARAHGVRVPDDLSVIGFDDTPPCASANPPLDSVRTPDEEMGGVAVELLVSRAKGEATYARQLRLGCALVTRGSSKAFRTVT